MCCWSQLVAPLKHWQTLTHPPQKDFTLCPDTLKAVRKWELMDVRLKFQLTSAPLSSVGGRQAEFEEISEAGITSPALIRVSKRPFLSAQWVSGIEGMFNFVNTNMANKVSPCHWWLNAQFYLFMLDPIDIEFKDRLLIIWVQHSVRINVAFFSVFFPCRVTCANDLALVSPPLMIAVCPRVQLCNRRAQHLLPSLWQRLKTAQMVSKRSNFFLTPLKLTDLWKRLVNVRKWTVTEHVLLNAFRDDIFGFQTFVYNLFFFCNNKTQAMMSYWSRRRSLS